MLLSENDIDYYMSTIWLAIKGDVICSSLVFCHAYTINQLWMDRVNEMYKAAHKEPTKYNSEGLEYWK